MLNGQHAEPIQFQVGLAAVAHVHIGAIKHDDGRVYVFFVKQVAELQVLNARRISCASTSWHKSSTWMHICEAVS